MASAIEFARRLTKLQDRRLVARHVDDVGNVGVGRSEDEVHQLAVAATSLTLDLCTQVLVELFAVLLPGALQLDLGARAQRGDELVVVAAHAHKAAVHRFVHSLAVVDCDVFLQATVVRLQARAALGEDRRIVCRIRPRFEHGAAKDMGTSKVSRAQFA